VWVDGDPVKPVAVAITYDNAGDGDRTNAIHIQRWSNNHVRKSAEVARRYEIPYVVLGQQDKKWIGWAHRMSTIFDYLHNATRAGTFLTNDSFVLLFDGRDCIFQQPWSVVVDTLTHAYYTTLQQRVLVGTEIWCCSKWLNHHLYRLPGMSENHGCGSYYIDFMRNQSRLAFARRNATELPFKHLNAGMVFGKVWQLLEVVGDMRPFLGGWVWDDQAKLTQLFYMNASRFHLDYEQKYFSNSDSSNTQWWLAGNGCFFRYNATSRTYYNNVTGTNPLLIHTSGRHWPCYNTIWNGLFNASGTFVL
jgi:hypothetical protein